MRLSRLFAPLLLSFFAGYVVPQNLAPQYLYHPQHRINCGNPFISSYSYAGITNLLLVPGSGEMFEDPSVIPDHKVIPTPTDGGIKEDIPDKYKERFERWKAELLATDYGRNQWDNYANNKGFILTITITSKVGRGAGTGKYLWDDDGRFVGATITLGDDLDRGYPSPVYYPVMNSLSLDETSYAVNPRILAATKLSHEIGHVDQTARANGEFLRLQDKLMPEYNSIFLNNGLKTTDKKLIELAQQMGGTPIEIWESREYWSEVEAMAYLKERLSKENFYCRVFSKIKQNVEEYARDYKDRFEKSPNFAGSQCWD